MKTKYFVICILLGFLIIGSAAIGADDIQYPVAELGNCKDEADCRSYCDKPDNYFTCFSFGRAVK